MEITLDYLGLEAEKSYMNPVDGDIRTGEDILADMIHLYGSVEEMEEAGDECDVIEVDHE